MPYLKIERDIVKIAVAGRGCVWILLSALFVRYNEVILQDVIQEKVKRLTANKPLTTMIRAGDVSSYLTMYITQQVNRNKQITSIETFQGLE